MPKKKKSKKLFTWKIALLIAVILIVLFIVGNIDNILTKNKKYDVTKTDIFSIPDIKGDLVSVKGISLGDDIEKVAGKLGKPDIQSIHAPNIANWEYRESLELPSTGLLIHMESGIVTKISIFKPFNTYLKGETLIDKTKDEIYRKYGAPDKTRLEKIYNRAQIVATYENLGFEFIIMGGDQIGFVITYPI